MFFVSDKTIRYRVEAVQRLHSPTMYFESCGFEEDNQCEGCCEGYEVCSYCDETYPCLTIRVLEGRQ